MPSRADALKAIPLFSGLSGKDRELIASCMDELSFPAGATLIREGQSNHTFFVLADGEADVDVAGAPRRTLRRGDFFGEISMQHRIPATATVVAMTPVEAFVMSHEQFGALSVSRDVLGRLQAAIGERLVGTATPPDARGNAGYRYVTAAPAATSPRYDANNLQVGEALYVNRSGTHAPAPVCPKRGANP